MTKLNSVKSGIVNIDGTQYRVIGNRPNKLKYRGTTVTMREVKTGLLHTISCTAAKKCRRVRSRQVAPVTVS